MTKKELVSNLFSCISNEIEIFDFRLDLKNERFIRKTKEAIFVYDIHFYNRTNIKTGAKGFLIEPYVWINVIEIEGYYKEITINKELKTDTDFITLGSRIAEFISPANFDGIHRNWNASLDLFVFEERDVDIVSNILLNQFKYFALPYFLKNGNIKAVDHLLNQHPMEYCVHMSNDQFRFIKGIIAAKLNNNPKLPILLETYGNLLIERDMPKNCIEEMSRLKSILPMIGANSL